MRARDLLHGLSRLVVAHPGRVLAGAGVFVLLCVLALPGLQVQAGHSGLVDSEDIHESRFRSFLRRFGSPNLLFVLIEGGTEGQRRKLVDRLGEALPATRGRRGRCTAGSAVKAPGCVRDVLGRIDLQRLQSIAPLLMSAEGLRSLGDALEQRQDMLARLASGPTLPRLFDALAEQIETGSAQAAPDTQTADQTSKAMRVFASVVDELAARTRGADDQQQPLHRALLHRLSVAQLGGGGAFSGIDSEGYLVSRDAKMNLAIVRPLDESDDPDVIVPFVEYVQQTAQQLAADIGRGCTEAGACPQGSLRVALTGMPALTAAERQGLSRDLTTTTVLAVVGILVLFVFGFRSIPQGLLGLAPLLVALLGTLAFVRLTIGSLNMLTSAFIPTVLGLGIDFSVHLLSRFNEARRCGQDSPSAVAAAITGAGPGMVTGALTTAGAFLALGVSDFQAFSHLGLITGVGLMMALAATLLVTSAMLAMPRLRRLQVAPPAPALGTAAVMARIVARHRWLVIGGALTLTAVMVWRAQRIPWASSYLDLLPEGSPAVDAMRKLASQTEYSGEVAALVADDVDQARRVIERLRKLPTVGRVESLAQLVPANQTAVHSQVRRLDALFAPMDTPPSGPGTLSLAALKQSVEGLLDSLQDARFAARRASRPEAEALAWPIRSLQGLLDALDKTPAEQARRRLLAVQTDLAAALRGGMTMVHEAAQSPPLTPQRVLALLPAGLADRLHRDGSYAIYIYPKHGVWRKGFLGSFVRDLRTVDPAVTGFPVTYWETSQAIEEGFRVASLYAALALFVLLFADFRNLRLTALAVFPLALGMAWMWGAISVMGISYNFANIIGFPLIIGIGVASGVHILHRYRQEGERDILPLVEHTGLAVLLSAATTMVGFGSLATASHRGAASLGLVLVIGVGACLATSTLVLPALLAVLPKGARQARRHRQRDSIGESTSGSGDAGQP